MLFKSLALRNQSPLQDYAPFLVTLIVLRGKFVNPSEFGVAVLAGHIPDHVTAGEHDSVLNLAVVEVHNFVEQECTAGGSCNVQNNV